MSPLEFEFVRLIGTRPRPSLPVGDLTKEVRLVWPRHGLCGAQGYYLTAPAMRKFLALGKVLMPYDVMLDLCQDEHDGRGGADYLDALLGQNGARIVRAEG